MRYSYPFLKNKMWIIVAEIESRRVKIVVEGLSESRLRKSELQKIDDAIIRKTFELDESHPISTYDVVVARASDFTDLKRGYPDFAGWDDITVQRIGGESQ